MTGRDEAFVGRVVAAADAAVDALAAAPPLAEAPLGPHRESMRRAKLLVGAYLAPGGRHEGDPAVVAHALTYVTALREMQAASGLFVGGNNVESPPDSGFTLNDVGDVLELVARAGAPRRAALAGVHDLLVQVADAAAPAMLAGGVHTPNHRWELAAALARLLRHRPDDAVRERIEQWLDEGVDVDADGLYSERSANYAAHVSNPALLALGDILDRPDLHRAVERNLEATLDLLHDDGSVETVHSRRQDQKDPRFPLAPLLVPFRRLAVAGWRADFAWAAGLAEREGIAEPQTVLADLLLEPEVAGELPPPRAPERTGRARFDDARLLVDRSPSRTLVVYGGSDHPRFGRIRSGLANNPTFLRLFAGDVVIESVRLSRDFFGLGPFRAQEMREADGAIVLEERLAGHYYQPLDVTHRRDDGDYAIVDEGRFAAAMAFDDRTADTVVLATRIVVRPTIDGVELEIDQRGPSIAWSLEVALRPGGTLEGGVHAGDGTVRLDEGRARYRRGGSEVEIGPGTGAREPAAYRPGEEYEYLGGTDAMGGTRLYVTGRAPGTTTVAIRRVG
ncbi:hypothetical protein [Isoptericola croceus]|uniref:hypothetical protein n=1 Tax=Isoptericola croceus TaxID=3031406 RepID=UPI0023F8E50F|nr:hypothetical protein [Isoptericola croceus]